MWRPELFLQLQPALVSGRRPLRAYEASGAAGVSCSTLLGSRQGDGHPLLMRLPPRQVTRNPRPPEPVLRDSSPFRSRQRGMEGVRTRSPGRGSNRGSGETRRSLPGERYHCQSTLCPSQLQPDQISCCVEHLHTSSILAGPWDSADEAKRTDRE